MSDKIKPKINPNVTFTVEESFNGTYTLVALDAEGNEKPRTEFSIDAKGFNKHYRSQTEGANPKFKVIKKNPKL